FSPHFPNHRPPCINIKIRTLKRCIYKRHKSEEKQCSLVEMENSKNSGINNFQMPLHYPRYTKDDYQQMPETTLDRLLAEYGLTVQGDITFKREFAIGAFLWPTYVDSTRNGKGSDYN
ncbi:uncharacterized protein LOC141605030, partial [Silene latifolia]|uniref:uncharacterized protein LOC141605030 n=1 Tax=Silene latifolia TaxID=37657 RepID=UPI003D785CC9